jgi:hypothetical protein
MVPLLRDFSVRIELCVSSKQSDVSGISLAFDVSSQLVRFRVALTTYKCSTRSITIDLLIGMACSHIQTRTRHAITWYVVMSNLVGSFRRICSYSRCLRPVRATITLYVPPLIVTL